MMMRMLQCGGLPVVVDGVRAADEDNPLGYYEFEAVKRTAADATWLDEARGKAVKLVYRLLYDLPPTCAYRVLFMRRRMEQVLASQRKMLERSGAAVEAVPDQQMARLFQAELAKVQRWLAGQPNFSVLEVDYNGLLAGPGPHIARINAFLGGGLDQAAMCRAVDPSLYRNRV
jgi:hypothetical protein